MIDQGIEKGPRITGAEGSQKNPDRQGSRSDESSQFSARSLKGAVLRVEIYALDRQGESDRPYSVSECNYTIKRLQPFDGNLSVRPSANARGGANLFRFVNSHITSAGYQAAALPYQEWDADEESLPGPRRRLIEHLRTDPWPRSPMQSPRITQIFVAKRSLCVVLIRPSLAPYAILSKTFSRSAVYQDRKTRQYPHSQQLSFLFGLLQGKE